ncbi:MAG: hypothetical protein WBV91_17695 [Desulfobacterales bacterium]
MILEGTATETGERFFEALVVNLAKALNTHSAWVTEFIEETRRLRALGVEEDACLSALLENRPRCGAGHRRRHRRDLGGL